MSYLLLMTLAGSTLFLGYLCWTKLCGSFVTQRMKYGALIVVLLVYAVPWMWLKGAYSSLSELFVKGEFTTNGEMSVSYADIKTEGEAYRTNVYWMQLLLLSIWLCGVLVYLIKEMIHYIISRKSLLGIVVKHRDSDSVQIAKHFQKEFRYKREPEIFEMPLENKTLAIGIIKPVILLQKEYAAEELKYIIKHEMVHIVRRDMLIKLLFQLVCCLHWWNPLVRCVLKRHFILVCETSCDERVISGCSDEERRAYAKLLIDNVCDENPKSKLGSALECDVEATKERVNLIMKKKNVKSWKKTAAAGVFALMLALNSLTALAYPDVYHIEEINSNAVEPAVSGNSVWVYDISEGHNVPTDVILYPEQFIDETGEIYPACSSQGLLCTIFGHDIVSGYFQTHEKNDNGGCTVKSYESTRCKRCNSIWAGDLVATTIYESCPHDH